MKKDFSELGGRVGVPARVFAAVLFVLAAGLVSSPARGELCTLDNVPAATLLLPYFEVDAEIDDGVTTLMSIGNAAAQPTLARVTLWTDLALPTFAFDLYLTGFDVQTINLRDVFRQGALPGGGPPLDPGPRSDPNEAFIDCSFDGPRAIQPSLLAELRKAHRGEATQVFGGRCGASPSPDSLVRGFVTVDVVERCSRLLPTSHGYFAKGFVLGYDNVLFGDFFRVEPAESFADGASLVRLEADPKRFGEGDRTFYGFLVEGRGSDHREPLPVDWSTRFFDGGAFSGGTRLTVWRGPTGRLEPFDCPWDPGASVHPPMRQALAFDEEQNSLRVTAGSIALFPYVANRRGIEDLPVRPPWSFGWLSLDLRPPLDSLRQPYGLSQAWVGATFNASGRFSVGLSGTPRGDPCEALAPPAETSGGG